VALLPLPGILLLLTVSHAVESSDCTAYKMTGQVTIDGKLDEDAWQNLPEHTGFFWKGTETYAGIQTTFQVGYDDQALYVSIRAEEPKMKEHIEHARKNDTGEVNWKYQLFEVFISPELPDGPQYYQFAVDVLGYRKAFRAQLEGAPYEYKKTQWQDIDFPWQAAVGTGSDFCAIEMRYPFKSLGVNPKPGEKWGFHVGRSGTSWPRAEKLKDLHWSVCTWSAWNSQPGAWRSVTDHGRMAFATEQLMAGAAQKLTLKINEAYYAWLASDKELEALIARTGGKPNLLSGLGREVRHGPENWQREAGLPWRLNGISMPWSRLLEWQTPVELNCNVIQWNDATSFASDYALECFDGKEWKVVYEASGHKGLRSCHIFPAVTATKVRLSIAACGGRPTTDFLVRDFGLYSVDDSAPPKD
jgi:hypothetical protein